MKTISELLKILSAQIKKTVIIPQTTAAPKITHDNQSIKNGAIND